MKKIDPYTCNIEELETEIIKLTNIKEEYTNIENSIKIYINSIYGACASPYFVGYNIYAAEAVTLQGQNIIFFTNKILDNYFLNYWHLDKELHKKLNLTSVDPIKEKTLIIYNDTDSTYLTFKPVLNSCNWEKNWKEKEVEFILNIKKFRIEKLFERKFAEYAAKFNTKDLQSLELETISYSALMISKKKYILNQAWKDPGVYFNLLEKIKPVGIEIIQSSTPKFSRKVLKELLNLLFKKGKNLKYYEVIQKLREYKNEFKMQNPEDISIQKSIGDYEKYITEDRKFLRIEKKCPINVRAAGIYNHILLRSKYKTKYNLLKTGNKLKYYYSKGEHNVFGFISGNYPVEFAYEINYDLQFEKTIVEPFNKYIMPLGFNPIPGQLIYSRSLF